LARIAIIEFQKKLAETNKMDMQFDYRPFILPNRPIEHMERKRMGLTTAVQNNLVVFQEGKTSITTRYVRRQIFRKDGIPAYTFIFSGTSMPITYRKIYEPGTIAPESKGIGEGTQLKQVDVNGNTVDNRNTADPNNPNPAVTTSNAPNVNIARVESLVPRSPAPPPEQSGRFMALAQTLSGWNPFNRTEDGGFGMFGMPKDLRDSLGIGDSTDLSKQVLAADFHWRGLVAKHHGDLDAAQEEFVLGAEKIKNASIVQAFKDGAGAVLKQLGDEFMNAAQPVVDGYNKLFPGEEEPVDESSAASAEAQAAAVAAEKAGPSASGKGFRTTQGILVFTRGDEKSEKDKAQTEETAGIQ
jgi:hypothetical protein